VSSWEGPRRAQQDSSALQRAHKVLAEMELQLRRGKDAIALHCDVLKHGRHAADGGRDARRHVAAQVRRPPASGVCGDPGLRTASTQYCPQGIT
jgi:hypothetical protein